MWRICLRSPILCTYSRCSENKCLILIHRSYSSVRFIFCVNKSYTKLYLLLWCLPWSHRFHRTSMFDSILFYFNRNKNLNSILCMQYPSFTRIWICIVFYHPLRNFFLSKDNGHFFTVTAVDDRFSLNFSINFSPMSVTCRLNRCRRWTFKL